MKLYFAGEMGGCLKILNEEDAGWLGSFSSRRLVEKFLGRNDKNKMFLDSGAYSVMTSGKKLDIDEYCQFIKQHEEKFAVYAGLDVIGDYKKTRENLEYMESKGLKPLPTFHYGSPFEELGRLVKKYDYIALGGLVPLSMKRKLMQSHLDKCFSIIKDRCKTHGFGVNAQWAWNRYPFYSVDASSWLSPARYGTSKFEDVRINLFRNKTQHSKKRVATELNYYKKLAKEITNLWKARGIIWK